MRCELFDVRLQQLLDQRRAPGRDPHLRRHAARCARCRDQLAATRRLLRGLPRRSPPPLDDDFAARVVQRVAPAPARYSSSTWPLVAAALAAALLMAVLPQGHFALRGIHQSAPDVLRSTGDPAPGVAASTTPSPENVAAAAPYEPWWTVYRTSIQELYPEQTRLRHRQQVAELAEELRPIATPFNATVTLLRRTIPIGRLEPKPPPNASWSADPGLRPSHV